MLMSLSEEGFTHVPNQIIKVGVSEQSQDNSHKTCSRVQMLRYLNQVLDRNKPLFWFGSKMNPNGIDESVETPSFSMKVLNENDA